MTEPAQTAAPRELTLDEQKDIEALENFMGRKGRIEWYFENGEWHPAWGLLQIRESQQ